MWFSLATADSEVALKQITPESRAIVIETKKLRVCMKSCFSKNTFVTQSNIFRTAPYFHHRNEVFLCKSPDLFY